jgi:hypothetical protein
MYVWSERIAWIYFPSFFAVTMEKYCVVMHTHTFLSLVSERDLLLQALLLLLLRIKGFFLSLKVFPSFSCLPSLLMLLQYGFEITKYFKGLKRVNFPELASLKI